MAAKPPWLTLRNVLSSRDEARSPASTPRGRSQLPPVRPRIKSIDVRGHRREQERLQQLRFGRSVWRESTNAFGARAVGEWVASQLCGAGERTYANGDVHEGVFVHGHAEGPGRYTCASGDCYEGQFVKGVRSGRGKLTWTAGHTYDGEWLEDQPHGQGTMVWVAGGTASNTQNGAKHGTEHKRYEGLWRCGRRHGLGVQTWADGRCFEGEWVDGEQHGVGRMRHAAAGEAVEVGKAAATGETVAAVGMLAAAGEEVFVGEWRRGVQEGRGTWLAADGRRYDGAWRRGLAHGPGRLALEGGGSFDGQFAAGMRHGVGTLVHADGGRFAGMWRAGRPEGLGVRVWPAETAEARCSLDADGNATISLAPPGTALQLDGVWHGGRRLLGGFTKRAVRTPLEVGFAAAWEAHGQALAALAPTSAPQPPMAGPPAERTPRARHEPARLRIVVSDAGAARVECSPRPAALAPWPAGGADRAGAAAVVELVEEHIASLPAPPALRSATGARTGASTALPLAQPPSPPPPASLLGPDAARPPEGTSPLGVSRLAPRRYLPAARAARGVDAASASLPAPAQVGGASAAPSPGRAAAAPAVLDLASTAAEVTIRIGDPSGSLAEQCSVSIAFLGSGA